MKDSKLIESILATWKKSEDNLLQESIARFNSTVAKAKEAFDGGNISRGKYHLSNARTTLLGMKSTDIPKLKSDTHELYKQLRDKHLTESEQLDESFKNYLPHHEDEKHKIKHEVFNMVQKSYESQGGIHGSGFKSPDDMVKNIPMWKVGRKNGKIHSVALYKDKEGRKRVAVGTDGSDDGKKAVAHVMVNDLKQGRSHVEVSGKSLSFIKKQVGADALKAHAHSFESAQKFHASQGDKISKPDEHDEEVQRHPELKDHMYTREIGGQKHTKIMLGTLGKTIK